MNAWHGREPDIRCDFQLDHCPLPASAVIRFADNWARAFCARHVDLHRRVADGARIPRRIDPLIRDPRIAACVVGAITGATPPLLADLLRAGCLDPAMLEVALDLVERLCLYDPATWPTDAGVEWPKVDAHGTGNNPHVWFTRWREGVDGALVELRGGRRQCTCGVFENGLSMPLSAADFEALGLPPPDSVWTFDETPDHVAARRLADDLFG